MTMTLLNIAPMVIRVLAVSTLFLVVIDILKRNVGEENVPYSIVKKNNLSSESKVGLFIYFLALFFGQEAGFLSVLRITFE